MHYTTRPLLAISFMKLFRWPFGSSDSDKTKKRLQDYKDAKKEYEKDGVEGCKRFLVKKLEDWREMPLNVAVIGRGGVGKSSFINAIRRMTADDEGAAEVGVTETTVEIKGYCHPDNHELKFWDLPGVGTKVFRKDEYLDKIKIERYDFFLLVTATRFFDDDAWLANEINKLGRKYFFVRTKIDADVANDKRSHPKTHKQRKVVDEIREDTVRQLEDLGCPAPQVFLIDNHEPKKFDFDKLEQSLVRDFPQLKQSAIIFSTRCYSEVMIDFKVEELRSRIWICALMSTFGAALVRIFDAPIEVEIEYILKEAKFYFTQLGLDDGSLQRFSKLTSVDLRQLKKIVSREFGPEFFTVQGIKDFVQSQGAEFGKKTGIAKDISVTTRILGSVLAATMSYERVCYLLDAVLDKMQKTAVQIMLTAAEQENAVDK